MISTEFQPKKFSSKHRTISRAVFTVYPGAQMSEAQLSGAQLNLPGTLHTGPTWVSLGPTAGSTTDGSRFHSTNSPPASLPLIPTLPRLQIRLKTVPVIDTKNICPAGKLHRRSTFGVVVLTLHCILYLM